MEGKYRSYLCYTFSSCSASWKVHFGIHLKKWNEWPELISVRANIKQEVLISLIGGNSSRWQLKFSFSPDCRIHHVVLPNVWGCDMVDRAKKWIIQIVYMVSFPLFLIHVLPCRDNSSGNTPFFSLHFFRKISMGRNAALCMPSPSSLPLAEGSIFVGYVFPRVIQGTHNPRVLRKNCLACL